jgi:hypothetical protein
MSPTLMSPKSFSFRFPYTNFVSISHLPMRVTYHAHFILLNLNNLTIYNEEHKV